MIVINKYVYVDEHVLAFIVKKTPSQIFFKCILLISDLCGESVGFETATAIRSCYEHLYVGSSTDG